MFATGNYGFARNLEDNHGFDNILVKWCTKKEQPLWAALSGEGKTAACANVTDECVSEGPVAPSNGAPLKYH